MQRRFPVSGRRRAPTPADLASIVVLVLLSVAAATWLPAASGARVARVRHVGGEEHLRLDRDQEREYAGPVGVTRVAVRDGAISITAAPCRRQLCRRMGPTRTAARSLVCIPNRIQIRIVTPQRGEAVDALSR